MALLSVWGLPSPVTGCRKEAQRFLLLRDGFGSHRTTAHFFNDDLRRRVDVDELAFAADGRERSRAENRPPEVRLAQALEVGIVVVGRGGSRGLGDIGLWQKLLTVETALVLHQKSQSPIVA
jgi:hypothetical protein